jgi:2-dehydropantoate 2-reductase
MMAERVLIVGSGAMACWYAARLAPHAVVTLAGQWTEGLAALRQGGVTLERDGERTRYSVGVAGYTEALPPCKLALVLVKAYQTEAAAEALARWLAPDGLAVTLQNGLGNVEVLRRRLGPERAVLGVTTCGATLVAPAIVRQGGVGPTSIARHPRAAALLRILQRAGLPAELADDAHGVAWGKLAISAAVNPVTALLRIPNGALLEPRWRPARRVAEGAMSEAAATARAAGIRLPYADGPAELEAVLRRTAANRASMLQDLEAGRPTEVEAINGAVVREAEGRGVPVPVNRVLLALIRSLAAPAEGGEQ